EASAGQQLLVSLAGLDPLPDRRTGFTQLCDNRRKIRFVDYDARLGMFEDGGQFERREPHIQRHHDRMGQRDAEIALQKLMGVEPQDSAPAPRLPAGCLEPRRQPFTALTKLRVREALVAGYDTYLTAVEIHAAIQAADRGQRYMHALRLYTSLLVRLANRDS